MKIKTILDYAKYLDELNIKYTWWKDGPTNKTKHPFYIIDLISLVLEKE